MEKKKKPNWFLRILGVLFVIYMSLTIAINTGYYEAKLSEKTTITEENMKQFEEDVKNGKEVDIKDYVTDNYEDYSNNTSKAGVKVSHVVENFMANGITDLINVLKKLFT